MTILSQNRHKILNVTSSNITHSETNSWEVYMNEKLWDLNMLLENYPALKPWGVRHLIRLRRIPIIKIGRRIYFDPDDIREWIEKMKIPAGGVKDDG